jgi:hypothetical protein
MLTLLKSSCRRGKHTRKDPAKTLEETPCVAALEIFNNYTHSQANLDMLRGPVLIAVLQTAILGMCEVEHYFERLVRKLDLLGEIETKEFVYLQKSAGN